MASRMTCTFSAHGGKFHWRNTSLILIEADTADTTELKHIEYTAHKFQAKNSLLTICQVICFFSLSIILSLALSLNLQGMNFCSATPGGGWQ